MKAFDHFTSLLTLISLIVLGPPLGRAILRNPKGPLTQALSTMVAVGILLAVYGIAWSFRPRSVSWYAWLTEIPVNGTVDVSGNIATDVSEPLRVQIER